MKSHLETNTRSYDLVAQNYKAEHGATLEWEKELQQFVELLPNPAHRIVDLGCGTGDESIWLAKQLPNDQVVAVDASSEMLKVADHSLPNVQFVQSNMVEFLPKGFFGGIWARASLHHLTLEELEAVFERMSGYLHGVLGMVNKYGTEEEVEEKPKYGDVIKRYFHYFDESLVERLASKYGFRIVEQYKVENDHKWLVSFLEINK